MTGVSDYLLTSSFCVRRSKQFRERLVVQFDVLCRSIHASFVDFVLLFSFHYETTTKAKFLFYAKLNLKLKSMKMGWIRMVKLEKSVR